MKKRTWINLSVGAVSLALLTGFGCQNKAAMKALEELTGQMAEEAKANHEILTGLRGDLDACRTPLSKLRSAPAVVAGENALELPSLEGAPSVAKLEAYKKALSDTIEKQKLLVDALKADGERCAQDLAQARKKVAAAAKAPAKEAEPTAVKKAEETGAPTSGVRSRYKPRTN